MYVSCRSQKIASAVFNYNILLGDNSKFPLDPHVFTSKKFGLLPYKVSPSPKLALPFVKYWIRAWELLILFKNLVNLHSSYISMESWRMLYKVYKLELSVFTETSGVNRIKVYSHKSTHTSIRHIRWTQSQNLTWWTWLPSIQKFRNFSQSLRGVYVCFTPYICY